MRVSYSSEIVFPLELIKLLRAQPRVAVLTGAGISAESGVPTFRDAQTGLWARFKPEELASPQAFVRNPKLVWEWYAWRADLAEKVSPNPGHLALAALEKRYPEFTLITQNVDGLHWRAGSQKVIELHGNLQRHKCFDCGKLMEEWDAAGEIPPRCPGCGGLCRPDIVWFGERLPEKALEQAWKAAENCQLFFSIGTSGLVEPAASLPFVALRQKAVVVEINLDETPLTFAANYSFGGPAGQVLPRLVEQLG